MESWKIWTMLWSKQLVRPWWSKIIKHLCLGIATCCTLTAVKRWWVPQASTLLKRLRSGWALQVHFIFALWLHQCDVHPTSHPNLLVAHINGLHLYRITLIPNPLLGGCGFFWVSLGWIWIKVQSNRKNAGSCFFMTLPRLVPTVSQRQCWIIPPAFRIRESGCLTGKGTITI